MDSSINTQFVMMCMHAELATSHGNNCSTGGSIMSIGDIFGMMFAIPIVSAIVYALKKFGFLRAASIILLVIYFPFTLMLFLRNFRFSQLCRQS